MGAGLIGLLILTGVVAAFALAIAFVLDLIFPRRSMIGKSLAAGTIATLIPLVPAYLVIASISGPTNPAIAIFPVVMVTLIFSVAVGFPPAFFLLRRRAKGRASDIDPDIFE